MKYLSLILVLALSANINSSPVKVNDGNKNIKPKLFEGDMAGVEFDANVINSLYKSLIIQSIKDF